MSFLLCVCVSCFITSNPLQPCGLCGVGCPALFQGIFLTQRSNPDLLRFRQFLYCLSDQGSPAFLLILIKKIFFTLNILFYKNFCFM